MSIGRRALSTAAQLLKEIPWLENGTTEEVGWVKRTAEKSLDHHPKLKEIVSEGVVNGNPHPTPKKKDTLHGSVLFNGKNGGRVVSAHVYPSGRVKFSKNYAEVNVGRDPEAPTEEEE